MPRVRFRVWSMMVAVIAVALMMGYLRRPYPIATRVFPANAKSPLTHYVIEQDWSDGRVREIDAHSSDGQITNLKAIEPWSISRRRFGPVLQVTWSDGTASYYLDGN